MLRMQQLTRMACVCVLAEEVCVEEMKACAADKECSMLHEKLQAAMKKDGGYGGKGGDGKYDDKKGGYGDKKDDKKEYDGKKEGGYDGKKEGDGNLNLQPFNCCCLNAHPQNN